MSCVSALSGWCLSLSARSLRSRAISVSTREALRLWVRQAEADAGTRNDRLTSAERERLKLLEREVRDLRKANEILKAASVFFAKELDGTPRR
jgi:transposase-like protein